MRRFGRAALAAALMLCGCQPSDASSPASQAAGLERATAVVTTSDGKRHNYRVEVARTAEEQARGMMHRREMPRDTGMVFPFSPPRPASFWMANTYLPLDIIFIDAAGRVLNVGAGEPLSTESVPSDGVTALVLELNAGEAARIGLKAGDRVAVQP